MIRQISQSFSVEEHHNALFYCLSDHYATLVLCVVGGFMDTTGYIKLLGLFATSVTGNLIVAATSVYKPSHPAICRVVVSTVFFAAAYVATYIAIRVRIVEGYSLRTCTLTLIVFTILLIVSAMVTGLVLDEAIIAATSINEMPIMLVGSLMGASMGMHMATIKECMPHSPATAVMTMNVVVIALNAAVCNNYFLAKHNLARMVPKRQTRHNTYIEEKFAATSKKLFKSIQPLFAFICGALLGTVTTYRASFYSLIVPIGLLMAVATDIAAGMLSVHRKGREEERVDQEYAARRLDPELGRDEDAAGAADAIMIEESGPQVAAF